MWDCMADDSLGKDVWHDPAFKIYRGLGNLVLLVYMWGVNIWVSDGSRERPGREKYIIRTGTLHMEHFFFLASKEKLCVILRKSK